MEGAAVAAADLSEAPNAERPPRPRDPPARVCTSLRALEPGEDHWHGAAPDRFMTHMAMQEVDESGSPVTWAPLACGTP